MSNIYTYRVKEGTDTFSAFIWRIAGGPKRQVLSDYYEKSVRLAEQRVAELETMTPARIEAKVAELAADVRTRNADEAREHAQMRRNYEAMIRLTEEWTPPTPDHEQLKVSALRELRDGVKFDYGDRDPWVFSPPGLPGDWHVEELRRARDSLGRARAQFSEQTARVAKENLLLDELQKSVPFEEESK